jgi:phosphatidylglycerophosphate synthase
MSSIRELTDKTQADKRAKSFPLMWGYSWHRNISIYLTWFLLKIFPRIKPQQVSCLMIVIGLVGALAILLGPNFTSKALVISGFLAIYLSFLLDKSDGEIARFKHIYPLRGVYLDELYHTLVPISMLIAVYFMNVLGSLRGMGFLMLAVILTLLIRYHRKVSLMLFVKSNKLITEGKVEQYEGNKYMKTVFNFFPIKISSIVERFDVVLILLFSAWILEHYLGITILPQYLVVYTFLSLVHFVRIIALNYYGGIDTEVERLGRKGY